MIPYKLPFRTAVLLNPSHATTTWTATDGDTGDLRGKPGAVLNFLSKGDVKGGKAPKAPASFQSLSTWRTGPQTVLCKVPRAPNSPCHALERNSEISEGLIKNLLIAFGHFGPLQI